MDEFSVDGPMSCHQQHGDATARCWALMRTWAVGLSLAIVCQSALAQAMYRIIPLGFLDGVTSEPSAAGFNDADEVAGTAGNSDSTYHAFLWKNDGNPMIDLGPDKVGFNSTANGLNASGQVTGSVTDSAGTTFAFFASGDGTPMKLIHDSLGGTFAAAYAINDLGQLTGQAAATDGTTHAFLWKNDGSPMTDLGALCCNFSNTAGYALNASGQIAGSAYYSDDPGGQAFVWKNDGTPLLPLGLRGFAGLINASGEVAGSSDFGVKDRVRAFLWRNDGTKTVHSLGTLGGAESFPTGLNDAGQVVGTSFTLRFLNSHAFIWMNDGTPMKDLGTLGGLSVANNVNASGQVVGFSYLAGESVAHTFLWRNDGGKMLDVNALIDPTDPLKPYITLNASETICCGQNSVVYINDSGDILSEGVDSRTGLLGLYLLQGTMLTLTPRSLAFGNQPTGKSSGAKSVTMTNTSPKSVPITITLTGTAAGQFTSTNTCGKSMAGHATCTIKVTFKPTAKGAKSETLNVNGGGGGLRSVALTGTGT